MLDNNGPVLQGCSQKNEVSKRTENLVFLKSFSGSKCKKSRDDSYESQMDTDGATQEHSSVSEKDARACHAQVLIGKKCKWKMTFHA